MNSYHSATCLTQYLFFRLESQEYPPVTHEIVRIFSFYCKILLKGEGSPHGIVMLIILSCRIPTVSNTKIIMFHDIKLCSHFCLSSRLKIQMPILISLKFFTCILYISSLIIFFLFPFGYLFGSMPKEIKKHILSQIIILGFVFRIHYFPSLLLLTGKFPVN